MSTTFFTADLHLGHANIIRFSERPFNNVEEMDEALIANWNDTVGPGDTVYFLGDLSLRYKLGKVNEVVSRLHGQKFLIYGNHDKDPVRKSEGWVWKGHYRKVKIHGQSIVLCHYAMRVWDQSHRGSWMLYGHSHGSLAEDPNLLSTDVGVDCHDYRPVSFERIGEIMKTRNFVPVDHHR